MSAATASFLGFWSRFTPEAATFVHPDDAGSPYLSDFELSLMPIPFVGHLYEAEAIILMLNPGLDDDDLAWEKKPAFRSALERNLSQSFSPDSYPQFYLDPALRLHPGAGYWAKTRGLAGKRDPQKLRSVIQALARRDSVSEAAAQAHVARKVAIIQLAPITLPDSSAETPSDSFRASGRQGPSFRGSSASDRSLSSQPARYPNGDSRVPRTQGVSSSTSHPLEHQRPLRQTARADVPCSNIFQAWRHDA